MIGEASYSDSVSRAGKDTSSKTIEQPKLKEMARVRTERNV